MPIDGTIPVLLSLGSNIESSGNLVLATRLLAERLEFVGASQVYRTDPVGVHDVATFLNAAVGVRFSGSPRALKFEVIRPIEHQLGRVRTADRNAPRPIDIDISLFGQLVMVDKESELVLPASDILLQAHVALPLADLAPQTIHPETGETLQEIGRRFQNSAGIEPLSEPCLSAGLGSRAESSTS